MPIRYTLPSIIWSVIILVLTLIPGKALPDVGFFQVDKLVHFFIFGVLMIFSSYGLKKIKNERHWPVYPVLVATCYSVFFGIMIEVLQQFVPGRSYSIADVIANCIGVAIGYFAFTWLERNYDAEGRCKF